MTEQTSKTGKLFGALVALVVVAAVLRLTGVLGTSEPSYDATVSGKVTIDGAPADRGKISFFTPDMSVVYVGKIESNGTYKVVPGRPHSVDPEQGGIASGEYAVAVSINVALTTEDVIDENAPRRLAKSLIASKYNSTATSGLQYTVKPGPNTINIELEGPDEATEASEESSAVEAESDSASAGESTPAEPTTDEATETDSEDAAASGTDN